MQGVFKTVVDAIVWVVNFNIFGAFRRRHISEHFVG